LLPFRVKERQYKKVKKKDQGILHEQIRLIGTGDKTNLCCFCYLCTTKIEPILKLPSFFARILWRRLLAGLLPGALAGFAWWYFVGCTSGTCPIKSNPWLMTGYGMLFGGVLFFKQVRQSQPD
jgi:hypothetical protein